MQDRRYRPGDVLDDYCPRERRITDHAIVAMIDDEIRRTRCGVCDAEHEYKEAKVPSPRRKTPPPALFTQVLEGITGPTPPAPAEPPAPMVAASRAVEAAEPVESAFAPDASEQRRDKPAESAFAPETNELRRDKPVEPAEPAEPAIEEGGFRRSLIRATFPRPEGQAPPPRALPEFTIQSLNNRGRQGQKGSGGQNRFRGGRRRAGGNPMDNIGPMRFRDHGHGQSQNGSHGQGQGQGQGGGRRRRGGKKNR